MKFFINGKETKGVDATINRKPVIEEESKFTFSEDDRFVFAHEGTVYVRKLEVASQYIYYYGDSSERVDVQLNEMRTLWNLMKKHTSGELEVNYL